MEINLDGHRKYRISLWEKFKNKAKKRCLSCDHYYPLVFTFTCRWVHGHFCLHWPEVYEDVINTFRAAESIKLLTNGNHPHGSETCFLYRNRKYKENPYNQLRPNKDYYDFTDTYNKNTIRIPPKRKGIKNL